MELQVIHVVRDLDAASGGPSRSVPALAKAQTRQDGVKASVLFRNRGNSLAVLGQGGAAFQAISGSVGSSLAQSTGAVGLRRILHLHGLWSPTLHAAARYARRQGLPYVVSTRGMLADWALRHRALKKRIGWVLYQREDLLCADSLVATSGFERQSIARLLPSSTIAIIPNGCSEPPQGANASCELPGEAGVRWALALGRLHPVKGYAELIAAWDTVRPEGWRLAIAGPDEEGYRAELEALIQQKRLGDRVYLLGEVGDDEKWSLLERCELFVAPSKTENFGMSIAEALMAGRPVITSTGTPWSELPARGCGWWIDAEVTAIAQALTEATQASTDVLRDMGAIGRRLVREHYSWDSVARQTIELYQSILRRRENGH